MDEEQGRGARSNQTDARSLPALRGRWLLLARGAWLALTAACVGLFVVGLPVRYAQLRTSTPTWPGSSRGSAAYEHALFSVFVLACLALAALLIWHASTSRMALYAAFAFVLFGTGSNGATYALALTESAWGTAARLLVNLGPASAAIVVFTFPDGRFVPRWTRWATVLGLGLGLVGAVLPGSPVAPNAPGLGPLLQLGFLISLAFAQVYRYRHVSGPVERQQTKWIVVSITAAFPVLGTILLIWAIPLFRDDPIIEPALISLYYFAIFLIPLSFTIALLRHRLWELDVLINRALVYGLLTGLLAAIYFGGVAMLQRGVDLIVGRQDSQPIIVASTLAIAALFQPLRRCIQSFIDRRFYRRKYDAARTLAAFSARLRDETELERLRDGLLATVEETMQPTHAALWLRPPEQCGLPRERITSAEGG